MNLSNFKMSAGLAVILVFPGAALVVLAVS